MSYLAKNYNRKKILTSPTYTAYWNGISKATEAIVPVALICAVT